MFDWTCNNDSENLQLYLHFNFIVNEKLFASYFECIENTVPELTSDKRFSVIFGIAFGLQVQQVFKYQLHLIVISYDKLKLEIPIYYNNMYTLHGNFSCACMNISNKLNYIHDIKSYH